MNLSEETLKQIETKIQQHHQIYRIPVKAESWEDLADQAINGEKTEYKPFNHNIVFDLNLTVDSNHYKSSLKAGVIKGNRLHFSSHRLGRFESLDDKINFLDNVEYLFLHTLFIGIFKDIHSDIFPFTQILNYLANHHH
jgi:hypothetical protein